MEYKRTFGHINGNPEKTIYKNREAVRLAGLHAHQQAGISGTGAQGADAIVLNGGYSDDQDRGEVIIYTGHGGKDKYGNQVSSQDLADSGNAGLVRSQLEEYPVRVIRGPKGDPKYSPNSNFRYDGLYQVEGHWFADHVDNPQIRVCLFRLVEINYVDNQHAPDIDSDASEKEPAARRQVTTSQIIRNPEVVRMVKKWHDNRCQVCGTQIQIGIGSHSQAAHIRALGTPHDGPDLTSNVLCLCPNHHVRFDHGGLYITDSLDVIDAIVGENLGPLRKHHKHEIDIKCVQYHRECWIAE